MLIDYILALTCVAGLSVGQVLFQRAALTLDKDSAATIISSLAGSTWLWSAVLLYAAMTLLWVYVLSRLPLQFAYPVYGFSFLFVPMLSAFFLGQSIHWQTAIGGLLIFAGVLLSAGARPA